MSKILTIKRAVKLSKQLRNKGEKLVLAGGCFDILHLGHVQFLEGAKKNGDHLMLLLESDATVTRLKGSQRPIHSQKDRATLLSALSAVDSICLLPSFLHHSDYDKLVLQLKPAIIATTTGDMLRRHKEKQAKSVDGKVVSIRKIHDHSTTKLAKTLATHFAL